jgi:hypothetical protein
MSSMLVRHPMHYETAGLMAGGFASRCFFDSRRGATVRLSPEEVEGSIEAG